MKLAYFDCFSGAAGDMILAALIDAGLPADELRDTLNALPIDGYDLTIERVTKQGFAATRFDVVLTDTKPQPHRHLSDIEKIIRASSLSDAVQDRALSVFNRLAKAEAEVHGTDIQKVHFHEVGAVDAIIDIVGASFAVERLGIERIVCSPLPTGSGTVRCQHGVMPVPAPATALLIKNVPIAATDETGELLTPTGAAILTEFAETFGSMPAMSITAIGTGTGTREGQTRPNILRVLLGESAESAESDRITVMEANIDDATPEILGHTMERLLNAGALDAYCVPIHMKKSRPGLLLTVLADAQRVPELERIVFEETTTFGVRRHETDRSKLARRTERVETPYGAVRVKIGTLGGRVLTVAPEYDDCRDAAVRHNVPLREVMSAATVAWNVNRS